MKVVGDGERAPQNEGAVVIKRGGLQLKGPGVAAVSEVIRRPMGSHSTHREQAAEVPE